MRTPLSVVPGGAAADAAVASSRVDRTARIGAMIRRVRIRGSLVDLAEPA
jgi:hypothetical protein